MNPLFYGILLFFITLIVLISLNALRKKTTKILQTILKDQNNTEMYFSLLKNPKLSLIFRKSTISLMELDGLLYEGNTQEARLLIEKLLRSDIKSSERLELYQKSLSFFIDVKDFGMAENIFKKLLKMLEGAKDARHKQIIEKAETLMSVYVYRDTGIIDTMIKSSENQSNKNDRAVIQYQIAKLAHFKHDEKTANSFLLLARGNIEDKNWKEIIEAAIDDHNILELK